MNKEAVLKTTVWSRDIEDGSFVVESPLMPGLAGAGETVKEAWESFKVFLDSAYQSYLEDRLGGSYGKRGRPAKDNIEIHVKVRQTTKTALQQLAEDKECSQGEVIDYLLASYKAQDTLALSAGCGLPAIKKVPRKDALAETEERLATLEARIVLIDAEMKTMRSHSK